MKVLIANWVYNWGSTGYILRDLRNELIKQGVDVVTVCGVNWGEKDDSVHCVSHRYEGTFFALLSRFGGSKFDGSPFAARRFIKLIKDEKPDIVHLHLMHCYCMDLFMVLDYLSKKHIKTVITHHAEIYYTGGCGYAFDCERWKSSQCKGCLIAKEATGDFILGNPHRNWEKMKRRLSMFDNNDLYFTAVSPWLKGRFEQSPFSIGYKCDVVMNGIDIKTFSIRKASDKMIKKRLKIGRYVIYVSAKFDPTNVNDIKGGYYVVEIAKRMPEEQFVVVATEIANNLILPPNVYLWGKSESRCELAELYSNASVTLLTSKKETFSMICAESLCCGTPVVGFLAGGPETISLKNYSSFVEFANLEDLRDALNMFIQTKSNRGMISSEAHKVYSRQAMASNYLKIYKKLSELGR